MDVEFFPIPAVPPTEDRPDEVGSRNEWTGTGPDWTVKFSPELAILIIKLA